MNRLNVATTPQLRKLELGRVFIRATLHAKEQAARRHIYIPDVLLINAGSVVELEHEGKQILKLVVRKRDVSGIDNVYVLARDVSDIWQVLTCYINGSDDNHQTLNFQRIGKGAPA
jgi:hypothetical protein